MTKLFGALLLATLPLGAASSGAAASPDARLFEDTVRPVLEQRCYDCHSHRADKIKGGLALDSRRGWSLGGDHGPAVIPGEPDRSLLIRAIRRQDPDRQMPPEHALTPAEVAALETWVQRGAPDPREPATAPKSVSGTNLWWALQPLVQPAVPAGPGQPIDAFIAARLQAQGLTPTPTADRRTLARRIYFDLLGLPPTPEELDRFLKDSSPTAYEDLVQRLLDSPRHGERSARHWMDAVHFAETHGHDQDRVRENAWPSRDYLINSFNADKPYDRFVQEQVAGDALFPDDPQAAVALGLLAAGPWDESTLRDIREDTLDREIGRYIDRDDMVTTVMQTFTSTTVQCARCHDHKFDPISQSDYYALQAVFAGVGRGNRRYGPDGATQRQRTELTRRLAAVEQRDPAVLFAPAALKTVRDWESQQTTNLVWQVVRPDVFVSVAGATLTRQPDDSFLASGPQGSTDTYTFTATSTLERLTAVRLEVLADDSLPQHGPGREPNGNLHLSEFQLLAFPPGATNAQRLELTHPSADFNQSGWTIAHTLDGKDATAWGIYPQVGQAHEAVFELREGLKLPAGTRLTFVLRQLHGGHCIGRPRLSVTDAEPPARAEVKPAEIRQLLATPDSQRSQEQRVTLARYVLRQDLTAQLTALPPAALVYAGAGDFEPDGSHKPSPKPRPVHLLRRGEITKPEETAQPGALGCVSALPSRFTLADSQNEATRRVALARWLTERDNPLTWRSIVNRVWQQHFGRGLVDTPNDFGRMGGTPSHPELLDWLAVWFRDEAHGSLKQLHRLIVTSATYRRAATYAVSPGEPAKAGTTPLPENFRTASAVDADDRLLWRRAPIRLEAEEIRDAVLQMSGRLQLRMGGPSDRMFDLQPGIHVTPKVDYNKFALDSDAGSRRSVYRFLFRTLPDPFMDALDCPAGDQLTPVRNASVTVQQALALWNNAFIARQAEHLAARLAREETQLEGQVRRAFELTLCRPPAEPEQRDFVNYAREHGLANLARLLFNSNEFMFLN